MAQRKPSSDASPKASAPTRRANGTAAGSAPSTRPRAPGRKPPADRVRAANRRDQTRRDAILKAAAETFYAKGYDATTTQNIADTVGMLKGSLYYYITAKEDLLYEIIDEVHEVLAKNLDLVEAMDGDALTRIWALVYHNVVVNAQNLINSAVFFRDFGALTGRRRKHILALRDKGDHVMRSLIAEGQAAGLVRADIDTKVAATAINTMCNALYHWYKPDGELAPEDVATSYADLAVAGLAVAPALVADARANALPR
jgi:AcrR family transcriptional regulator